MNTKLICACSATALLGAAGGYLLHEQPRADVMTATVPQLSGRLSTEQQKTRLRLQYGWAFRELALSDAQASALLELLEQQAERRERATEQRSLSQRLERAATERRELETALGADKAAEFERMRKTILARSELQRIRDQLENIGEPLTHAQEQQLQAATRDLPLQVSPRGPSESLHEYAAHMREATQALRQRFHHVSASVLTPEQARSLDDIEAADQGLAAHTLASVGPAALSGGRTR